MESIRVDHLRKSFGKAVAVDDVSFSVHDGEFFGFLGPNGAGKSTTINILCTLLRPTGGSAWVNGFDVVAQPHLVRRSIGLVFQESTLDDRLTGLENLEFHARIYNVPDRIWKERSEQLLKMVGLWERRNDLVRTFSGGMRRRLEVVRGLLHNPRILFLDEPTLGLDPQTRQYIWRYLLDLREREHVTLFLTTHYMDEAEQCDRIAIIDHGRIVALDRPDQLKEKVGGDVITIQTPDLERAAANLRSRFGLNPHRTDGQIYFEAVEGGHLIPRLVVELGAPIAAITLRQPTLDDVFLKLTGTAIRDQEASDAERMRAHAHRPGR
jgi:ABC-2 type transport system ATP-binding protein